MANEAGMGKTPVVMQVLPALETGGLERGTIEIAQSLVDAGFKAVVVSSGGQMVRELDRMGAIHVTLPVQSKKPWMITKNIKRLEAVIREHEVDIVHARSRAPAWSALYAAKNTGANFMTTFHGTYNFKNALKKKYNAVMTMGERVIAISGHIRDHILAHYTMEPDRIRLIHRCVDVERFDPESIQASRVVALSEKWRLPDELPVIMLPGRLTRWKGPLLLIEALALLKSRMDTNLRCLLVGDDQGREGFRSEVENAIKKSGLEDWVHITGGCTDMPAAYKLADIIISASTDPEAFGRVAVEGQAMGRLVIAPAHGGALEQVTVGKNGWLFEPGNAHDLADKLEEALTLDADKRLSYFQAGMENARTHFSKSRMCNDTLAVYRELLSSRRGFEQTPENEGFQEL